jgi:glycosyltransferase involved in cell wall biosynthesis
MSLPGPLPGPLSVCIIACKDLSLNMRTIRQARSLAEAGHQVMVVGYKTPDPRLAGNTAAANLIATGAPPLPAALFGRVWLHGRLLRNEIRQHRHAARGVAAGRSRTGLFASRAAEHLADHSFDVVQAHFDKALIAASALAARCDAKLVFDSVEIPFDHEMLPRNPTERVVRLAEIRHEMAIAKAADAWITVNESIADHIAERFAVARPHVLRNLPDAGYQPSDGRLRRDLRLPEEARLLLHLNTMRRGEGLETAIDALARLPQVYHLVGLGPTPQRSYLKAIRQRAAARGVADRFHLAPMQPPHAVARYIAGANIGIIARESKLQNLRLSLPNRLFQLIAARLPVVVTPLHEIARIVRERRIGLVFEEEDAAGLAAAISEIDSPAAAAQFRQAVIRAAGSLTWQQESAAYVRFIEDLARPQSAEMTPSLHLAGVADG